ncbi:hypothetical protein G6F32_016261 [Rhizopus arrhizus]|nr:hypothetical protein G6F32_016261 [Rhizopus arrhizus]
MRFPQQHRTVLGLDAIQLFAQLGVIGLPIGLQAVRALGVRQHGVVLVERVAAERLGRAQAGLGLAGREYRAPITDAPSACANWYSVSRCQSVSPDSRPSGVICARCVSGIWLPKWGMEISSGAVPRLK